MIYLKNNTLHISFPEIHKNACAKIEFQRTLRIPDNDTEHNLPPGLGKFPLRHIEDFDLKNANHLKERGGIIMPMFQADALWLNFDSEDLSDDLPYPIAIKVGTGKICAISGEDWSSNLNRDPQDYAVIPDQPWLDGYNIGKDTIRQFVAAPLGSGHTVEEQITGNATVGGIQIEAYPMKAKHYEKKNKKHQQMRDERSYSMTDVCYSMSASVKECSEPSFMGLTAGGLMKQEIFKDEHKFSSWDMRNTERCFITIANAQQWMSITKEEPPITPISAKAYTAAGLPWFDYYDGDKSAIEGAKKLGTIKSIKKLGIASRNSYQDENEEVINPSVITTSSKVKNIIKEGKW